MPKMQGKEYHYSWIKTRTNKKEKNKQKDAMKKIDEHQNANNRKSRFYSQEVKDSKRFVKL